MMQAGQLVAVDLVGSVNAPVATVSQYLFAPLTLDQSEGGIDRYSARAAGGCRQ